MADILVVDDEKKWRELYTETLENAGHSVRSCDNGVTALVEIKHRKPELVSLDIRMSPTGRDILRSLKRVMPNLPVVIASAYAGYQDDPEFAAANAFVEKSPDTSRYMEVVNSLLARPM